MSQAQADLDLLQAVVAAARRSATERQRVTPDAVVERDAAGQSPRGDLFVASLRAPGIRVIAECKRRSPSRGVLRPAYDPAAIAASYAAAGAAAISVLTEPTFFDGSLDHLRRVRAAVPAGTPLLCKDFLVTERQILEARAAGADAVLLIVAALDDAELKRLLVTAQTMGLAALVEVHDAEELARARAAGARVIGVNSRDLRTLAVNGAVFDALAGSLPRDVVAVAESGLKTGADLSRLRAVRYDAFLVGERFMTQPDPGAALGELLGAAQQVQS